MTPTLKEALADSKKLSQYSTVASSSTLNAQKTIAPAAPPLADVKGDKLIPPSEAIVTPQASAAESILSREEKIEYRDQDGNLLDEAQVKALEGKVSFSTRYETRTRLVDAHGREVAGGPAGGEGFAPPHPDVEREPETKAETVDENSKDSPATVSLEQDIAKEKSIDKAKKDSGSPRPASEGIEATK